jgi:hypothetical protein
MHIRHRVIRIYGMGFWKTEIAPPEFDVGCLIVCGIIAILMAIVGVLAADYRYFALWTIIALANLYNGWRAWRYLPNRAPVKTRFSLRDLLILMTVLALTLGFSHMLR